MNEQNRYLFIYTFISFIIAALTGVFLNYKFDFELFLYAFVPLTIIFVPFLFVLLFSAIGYLTDKKFHKVTVIITGILNVFIIAVIQILLPLSFFGFYSDIVSDSGIINDVKQYNKALKEIDCQKCIEHFPKQVPPNAQNVKLHKYTHPIFGSEGIVLTFDADKNYIKNAIKQNKYQRTITPIRNKQYGYYEHYDYVFGINNLPVETYKLFVIYQANEYHNAYGIGVKDNNIMYFYSNPD